MVHQLKVRDLKPCPFRCIYQWLMRVPSFAVTFKKVNSPARHFTQHMERQLHDLRRNFGCETDEVLAQLIYGQRISEMVAQFQQSDQSVDVRLSSTAWTTKLDSLLLEFGKLRGSESHQQTHHCEHTSCLTTLFHLTR